MWMSKQTDSIVRWWSAAELDPEVRARTGLNNDSYFTAPKLAWFMERVFEPEMDETMRAALYDGWCDAVRHVRAAAAEHLASPRLSHVPGTGRAASGTPVGLSPDSWPARRGIG